MSRPNDPRPPAYYTDRDSLLSQSSSSSTRDNVPPYLINYHSSEAGPRRSRRPIASPDRDADDGSMCCCCADRNTFFIVLFGAIAGVNIWLTVKSSRPDGVSNFERYFAWLMAFVEFGFQAAWVLLVWPFRVWHRWYSITDQQVVHTFGKLLSVKIVLFWFNFIYAWAVKASYSWVLAWIAGFTSVDFAVSVVVGLCYNPGDALVDIRDLRGV